MKAIPTDVERAGGKTVAVWHIISWVKHRGESSFS